MTPRMWLHGLVAAFIGGAATMLSSSLALMVMNPEQFNMGPQVWHTLRTVLVLGLISGAQTAAAYLKQSPLWEDATTERRTVTDARGSEVLTETKTTAPATKAEVDAVHKEPDK